MEAYKFMALAFVFFILFIVFLFCLFFKGCWNAFKKGWDSE